MTATRSSPPCSRRLRWMDALPALAVAAALGLGACVSDGFDLASGAALNIVERPQDMRRCSVAGLTRTYGSAPEIPARTAVAVHGARYPIVFDVDASGVPVNVRYVGEPRFDPDHSRAVRAAVRAVAGWRYAAAEDGQTAFLNDCHVDIEYDEPDILPRDNDFDDMMTSPTWPN